MKRTAAITLLCMGVGAAALGSAFREPCVPQSQAANQFSSVGSGQTNPRPQSCSSGAHGGHGSFVSGVARGGFGGAGVGAGG
jgi:hypothetical protein